MFTEKIRLVKSFKLNEELILAGTPVKLLQTIGTKLLIQIPLVQDEIQKLVDPEDLQIFRMPSWYFNTNYNLKEIDLLDSKFEGPKEDIFEAHC
jgi:hypothetical protein